MLCALFHTVTKKPRLRGEYKRHSSALSDWESLLAMWMFTANASSMLQSVAWPIHVVIKAAQRVMDNYIKGKCRGKRNISHDIVLLLRPKKKLLSTKNELPWKPESGKKPVVVLRRIGNGGGFSLSIRTWSSTAICLHRVHLYTVCVCTCMFIPFLLVISEANDWTFICGFISR